MSAEDPYRRPNGPALFKERLQQMQAVCTSVDVSPLLGRLGVSRAEAHDLFNLAQALFEALGDSMEEVWQTYSNVGRCAACGQQRWSVLPDCYLDKDTPQGTRECNVCHHRWMPLRFNREEDVFGRLRHYLNQQANHGAGEA